MDLYLLFLRYVEYPVIKKCILKVFSESDALLTSNKSITNDSYEVYVLAVTTIPNANNTFIPS